MTNFNKITPFYDGLVKLFFGDSIQSATNYYLDLIPANSKILILGGGTGQLLDELNRFASGSDVTYVDTSQRMLEQAKLRNYENLSVKYLCQSAFEVEQEQFDVIITPFFLDLFTNTELQVLSSRLGGFLSKGGYWLFSDFVDSGKIHQKLFIRFLYLLFNFACGVKSTKLPDYGIVFGNDVFSLISDRLSSRGLITSRIYRHV